MITKHIFSLYDYPLPLKGSSPFDEEESKQVEVVVYEKDGFIHHDSEPAISFDHKYFFFQNGKLIDSSESYNFLDKKEGRIEFFYQKQNNGASPLIIKEVSETIASLEDCYPLEKYLLSNYHLSSESYPSIIIYYDEDQTLIRKKTWVKNALIHRDDLPAITLYDIDQNIFKEIYLKDGAYHRDDGPAIIFYEKGKITKIEYMLEGVKLNGNKP